ncbi:MAG TPA: beta-ketoacyl-ACP synthase 3 [Planctomycetaceae bacterium]|nr:beta-ketoacyl-ACP synthase 3 [Planctomycetaceae bacterium]
MDRTEMLRLYRVMLTSRRIDELEEEMTHRGEAFFQLSAAGHEATAALVSHLHEDDWLHCHYRDRALLIARGLPVRTFFDNLLCNDHAPGRGRRMSPFMSDPALKILSMVTPTGNNALQSVGVAAAVRDRPGQPIVYNGVGDGTTQQGEFLEACAEAARSQLPVLFVVQDNKWAISTQTQQKTFYSLPEGKASDFCGIPIEYANGCDATIADEVFQRTVARMRSDRKPAIIVLELERLASHTNADDQRIYREQSDLEQAQATSDPITIFQQRLLDMGFTDVDLQAIDCQIKDQIEAAQNEAMESSVPLTTKTAKRTLHVELTHPSRQRAGAESAPQITMREALRNVLHHHLVENERVTLFGEDIEDPKGDVFGVTKGLSTEFPSRVRNSPLSESTIIGTSIGRALAGEQPVAFLQFADFIPLAFNQIASELSTIHWRSDGKWSVPVITMIACGGYRPGLGPYHAQTFESILAHNPGIDVFMPSTAEDAVGLLNAAFASERPTMFLYPKTCLNDTENTTSADVANQFVPIGTARKVRSGRDVTFVCWGNTVRLCSDAANVLEKAGVEAEVIDLRSLYPWDEHMVLTSAEQTARLIVVHEDNRTCGLGAEILATVGERARLPISMRRVTRPDTYVPCNFVNQIEVLPSFKSVLTTAAELLNLDLSWIPPKEQEQGVHFIDAIGSGPSDEHVIVVEVNVQAGQQLSRGDVIASLEATKSVFEITSPVDGTVEEIFASEGATVPVGEPLMKIQTEINEQQVKPVTQENPGTPVIKQRKSETTLLVPSQTLGHRAFDVGISSVSTVSGSRLISNSDLNLVGAGMKTDDIIRLTGIEFRHWAAEGEDAVSMAVDACWQVLEQERLIIDDLDLVICSTTSPQSVTPSMACRVLNGLTRGKSDTMLQAYDINAACSGYLYALQAAYDFLQSTPRGRVLVVTAEVLSPLLNPDDFDTAILFGDATTATILYGESHFDQAMARLHRPELSAKGEDGSTLSVPFPHDGFIQMKGRKVFTEAVRSMISSLTRVCQRKGIQVNDLNLIVPHQANQRIIDAIQSRVEPQVFSNIRHHGNTSSSSIPLCLNELLPHCESGQQLGLCAFGGGFTFGAGILESI